MVADSGTAGPLVKQEGVWVDVAEPAPVLLPLDGRTVCGWWRGPRAAGCSVRVRRGRFVGVDGAACARTAQDNAYAQVQSTSVPAGWQFRGPLPALPLFFWSVPFLLCVPRNGQVWTDVSRADVSERWLSQWDGRRRWQSGLAAGTCAAMFASLRLPAYAVPYARAVSAALLRLVSFLSSLACCGTFTCSYWTRAKHRRHILARERRCRFGDTTCGGRFLQTFCNRGATACAVCRWAVWTLAVSALVATLLLTHICLHNWDGLGTLAGAAYSYPTPCVRA
jgi:hypothetical protein